MITPVRWTAYRVPPTVFRPRNTRAAAIVYLPNFLDAEDFALIQAEVAHERRKCLAEENSIAEGRLGTYITPTSPILETLVTQQTAARIAGKLARVQSNTTTTSKNNKNNDNDGGYVRLRVGDFPVEMRVYPSGSHMPWHADEALYVEPQVEVVYTVANTSDSLTEWREEDGTVVSERTAPNSLLAIVAEGWEHRVTPVRRGERTILKFVLTTTDTKLTTFEDNLSRPNYRTPQRTKKKKNLQKKR